MMNPMLGLTTHLSMPACVHDGGDWASAAVASITISVSAARNEQRLNIEWSSIGLAAQCRPRHANGLRNHQQRDRLFLVGVY
jgi:3'-phosphoadenosine 5'-phosphosulfate sulfotransferase